MAAQSTAARPGIRALLYSHDTFGLGHLRRARTIAAALTKALPGGSALIVTGSPVAGRFDFADRVDHVRLPGVVKHADGSYTASNLSLDIDAMARLRGAVIEAAAREFEPDLLIVDKEPWGFRHEMAETLSALRARGTRIVLGIRDVLDEEDALAREWERKGAIEAIERFYDEIWVYGLPALCRPLSGLGLSPRMEARTVYTGYLRRDLDDGLLEPDDGPEEPFVLVTTGGGGDGAMLIAWVIRAFETEAAAGRAPGRAGAAAVPRTAAVSGAAALPRAHIVYGPFLDAGLRADFDDRLARLGGRVTAIGFTTRLEALMARAAGVVAMGGYNTFCEILSADRPAIIVPRTQPRREQLLRAAAAERLGLVTMLTPVRDGAEAAVMAQALADLATRPAPSAAAAEAHLGDGLLGGLMGGLDAVVARTHALAAPLAAAGE
ncbi:MAG: glycosyltransferase [Pseudomonadota bacterium]